MSKGKKTLTHFDERGNAHMVDVGGKDVTERVAAAANVNRGTAFQGASSRAHAFEVARNVHTFDLKHVAVKRRGRQGEVVDRHFTPHR